MSFQFGAGHVAEMIARLQANARPKRTPFDRQVEVSGQRIRAEFLKRASPEEIAAVKERMKVERRKEVRRSILLSILSLLFLGAILWVMFV